MTHTEQTSSIAFLAFEEKNTEKPTNIQDPKAFFLDSMEKLLVELDGLTEITENYLKNMRHHQKNQEEMGEN